MPVGNDTGHDVEWRSDEGDPGGGGGGNITMPTGGAITAFAASGLGTLALVAGCFGPPGLGAVAKIGAALSIVGVVLLGALIYRGRRRDAGVLDLATGDRPSAGASASLQKAIDPCGPTLHPGSDPTVKLKVGSHVVFCYKGKEIGRSVTIADENAEVRIRHCLTEQQASAGLRTAEKAYHVDVL